MTVTPAESHYIGRSLEQELLCAMPVPAYCYLARVSLLPR